MGVVHKTSIHFQEGEESKLVQPPCRFPSSHGKIHLVLPFPAEENFISIDQFARAPFPLLRAHPRLSRGGLSLRGGGGGLEGGPGKEDVHPHLQQGQRRPHRFENGFYVDRIAKQYRCLSLIQALTSAAGSGAWSPVASTRTRRTRGGTRCRTD